MSEHPDARLVVIDTFAKVTPPRDGRKNAYNEAYGTSSEFIAAVAGTR